jgi:site-specific recombinase XerD
MSEDFEGIKLVPGPTAERLDGRRRQDYAQHRRSLIEWLLVFEKDPEKVEGYANATALNTAERLDRFYRWVWSEFDGYTTDIDHDDADAYMRHLTRKDEGDYSRNNHQSAIKRLFKWQKHERGGDLWEPKITLTEPNGTTEPRDFLQKHERR